ncbi:neurogenic locus notch homolog protein 3-like [Branchiostoma floridae]|uniref:Neurogenic locus notch homolog protein 3-like n=1 Tax=Branchiostoma floridae TaxID=7739 RepID=A0A9J7NAV0_BRAFL|nr:neurogenic locus notch homolog protein 3-like [Branchiostoma floridae]
MWKFLLLLAAVGTLPAASVGEQVYLTTVDNWSFWKIRATGPMTDDNVKVTCEAAGMRYPCFRPGADGCGEFYWASDCIKFHHIQCTTLKALSSELCGHTDGHGEQCQPLDDTFVYNPAWYDDSAYGVDFETHDWGLQGADYNNMYALCAAPTCGRSPCAHGTCTDDTGGYTCSCENGWEGTNCDQNIDECASFPCAHGACNDTIGSFTCSCDNGWTGLNCDQDIDECASSPCWLGGTCLDHVNGYSCVCLKDVTGRNCETGTTLFNTKSNDKEVVRTVTSQ